MIGRFNRRHCAWRRAGFPAGRRCPEHPSTPQIHFVKKFSWPLVALAVVVTLGWAISSCRKINEATELGGGLVPPVDNINTFDTVLDVHSNNVLRGDDSAFVGPSDEMAIGALNNDPEFGKTTADLYFHFGPTVYKRYPFVHRDSLPTIDSVVLSIGYTGNYYGDTSAQVTFNVAEITDAEFKDSSNYAVNHAPFQTGASLGSKTFRLRELNDSVPIGIARDTFKVANVVRIKLNNSIGERLKNTDTSVIGSFNSYGNFYRDFKGIAVTASSAENAIGYFTLADTVKTRLIVYYHEAAGQVRDTSSASFPHGIYGAGYQTTSGSSNDLKPRGTQANLIQRTPGGPFQAALGNGIANDEVVYIQSEPGSGATIHIPGLSTLSNRVVHRAELIVTREPNVANNLFPAPPNLLLARGSGLDTLRGVTDDSLTATIPSGSVNASLFGGNLMDDGTYRFNLTRHVQGIITNARPNDTLFLFAPFRYILKDTRFFGGQRAITVLPRIAYGRVAVSGGAFADRTRRMRMRIVYSKL
ncbi:MAG: DUF4270 family protein [Chitinophagaceae bacterium]|nr:MAG: DUF4270 family protein [Chitinophagaceae bacterium]